MIMKIGIFGGAFDPVHMGHLNLAELVYGHFALDKLIFVPTKTPPHKGALKASATDRLNMLKLAIENYKENFFVSDIEINSPNVSYTYDTLMKMSKEYPQDELLFICGSDIFSSIESWYKWRGMFDIASFIVVKRSGMDFKEMFSNIHTDISSYIDKGKIVLFEADVMNISSTEVRLGKMVVSGAVLMYIDEHKLYTEEL